MSKFASGCLSYQVNPPARAVQRHNEFGDTIFIQDETGLEYVSIAGKLCRVEDASNYRNHLAIEAGPHLCDALLRLYEAGNKCDLFEDAPKEVQVALTKSRVALSAAGAL